MPESELCLEYQRLLRDLKITVECLLLSQIPNVWNIYGGLNRLHNAVEKIFCHCCKIGSNDDSSGCWSFINGVNWLQPNMGNSTFSLDTEYQPHHPPHLRNNKASLWIYKSLENHNLSQKLSWLLSDKEHILSCYHKEAFLNQSKYAEAVLICLMAVERNQASLMSDINPCLYVEANSFSKSFSKSHRRCFSNPDTIEVKKTPTFSDETFLHQIKESNRATVEPTTLRLRARNWKSLPNLHRDKVVQNKLLAKLKHPVTTPSSPKNSAKNDISPNLLKVDYMSLDADLTSHRSRRKPLINTSTPKKLPEDAAVRQISIVDGVEVEKHTPDSFKSSFMTILSSSIDIQQGKKDTSTRRSFIEGGGSAAFPIATGYFPRPTKGQTLTSFLTSNQFSRANAELDRENAHFSISEAMISAIEQIRWRQQMKLAEERGAEEEESDEEIKHLKQRIRLRRRQKLEEHQRKLWSLAAMCDRALDTTTTEASLSPASTSYSSSESNTSDDVEDLEVDEASNLIDHRGVSMSMASLYSEADLRRRPRGAPDGQSDILSAEGVALSLISRFNEKQLPRASDLDWIVSEEDAPQALLPMPKSWPVSPDDAKVTPLRGTNDWAPPRPQIIFTPHPSHNRKAAIAKQNFKCAGCGMKVAPQYASTFRYCEYLGRYFCTGCHKNQLAAIPGKVIHKWDFTKYAVSSFSYRLLEQMHVDPLFRIVDLNKNLFGKSRQLSRVHQLRLQMYFLKDFIMTCRFAEPFQHVVQSEPNYVLTDPELYSMQDLVDVRSGDAYVKLRNLVGKCLDHITICELCTARGFICEVCRSKTVIFPWQLAKVRRCSKCGACFHKSCWNPSEAKPCKKCARLMSRQSNSEPLMLPIIGQAASTN